MTPHRVAPLTFALLLSLQAGLFGHGNAHKLILEVNQKLEGDPGNPQLILERAELWLSDGNYDEALADILRAEAGAPSAADYNMLKGRAFYAGQWPQSAIYFLDKTLADSPGQADALLFRARSHLLLRNFAAASEDFDAAIPLLDDPQPDDFLDQARAHSLNGNDGAKLALERLDAALKERGNELILQEEAIEYERRLGNWDGMLDRLASLKDQMRADVYLRRKAEMLRAAERFPESKAAYEEAIVEYEKLPDHLKQRVLNRRLRIALERGLQSVEAELEKEE